MSTIKLSHSSKRVIGKIAVPGSKSESNRLLLLRQLYFPDMPVHGLSDSSDTTFMTQALQNKGETIDVGDAGTAMRFLTAYFSTQEGRTLSIDGTERMRQRPIGTLVDALRSLGASIEYLGQEGYPPLKIEGNRLKGGYLEIDGSVSSQFISALMMIAPGMELGMQLKIKGFSVSAPYIYLTANLMRRLGLKVELSAEEVEVAPGWPEPKAEMQVEPDWSAASYWFLIALLADQAEIYLPGFRQYSLQGDAFISGLFEPLGVDSYYIGSGFRLKKAAPKSQRFDINLVHNPDLAQTMAVAFAAKQIPARIKGLQTLKIKETDRLQAVKTELEKAGAQIEIGPDFLEVKRGLQDLAGVHFETYKDHRMAMSLAPLALLAPISIANPDVVNKSYQSFWSDLQKVGFEIH